MKTDDNWKQTRLLAEDLDSLLGLPVQTSEEFLKILENLIIHKFVELISEQEEAPNKDYQIDLPYLGSLIVTVNNKNKISLDFVVRNLFYNKIKSAYYHKESPLVKQCEKILGKDFVIKFEEGTLNNE